MNTLSKYTYAVALPMMLLLAGCSGLLLRSQYTLPEVTLPQQWQESSLTGTTVATKEQWWQEFNDPVLSELIEKALASNNNLAAATIRVKRAQLSARLTDTNRTPSVTVGASSTEHVNENETHCLRI